MDRRGFCKLASLTPALFVAGGINVANLVSQVTVGDHNRFREEMNRRYQHQIISTELLIDFINDVVTERGL